MLRELVQIGTLLALVAALAPARVSNRHARTERHDSGRHAARYCYSCARTASGRIRRDTAA
jgi:hypothetical protein